MSSDLSIAMLQAPESDRYGSIVRDTTLRVTAMPSGRAVKGSPCNGGVYLINRYILEKHNPGLKHFSFEDQWLPDLLNRGVHIYGFEMDGKFIDIGLPHEYDKIQKNKNIFF